jgi:hypothetical protein
METRVSRRAGALPEESLHVVAISRGAGPHPHGRVRSFGALRGGELARRDPVCYPCLRAEYHCSFETNAEYVSRWQEAGLCVTGLGDQGELRAFSLPASGFFLATLFQPQLSSRASAPHPIIAGFLRACLEAATRSASP